MAQTLLFVHGTGVREAGYRASVAVIEKQMQKYAPKLALAPCCWGDSAGAKLNFEGASVPTYGESRGIGVSDADAARAMWQLLLRDPGFELGMLATSAPPVARPPKAGAAVLALRVKFRALPQSDALKSELAASGLDGYLAEVVTAIEKSPGYVAAEVSPLAGKPEHRQALARAVVAGLQKASLEAGGPTLDAPTRDALTHLIAPLLGQATRGVIGTVAKPFLGLAASIGTWQIRRRRTSLTDAAYPAAGDILVYQADGGPIRKFIRDEIAKRPDDEVFVFAHSLGGVACFELLVRDTPANVKGLITFGSQAPFFFEIGALRSLGLKDKLPAHFPPWLNFYDLADPLSYIGGKLFVDRVADERIESGESFPASHSAYLASRELWIRLAAWVEHHA
jgi:hypothetical protein